MERSKDLWMNVQYENKSDSRRKVNVSLKENESTLTTREKMIEMELTDVEDPFFYYSMTLTDSDFQRLKSQQGLLVDFSSFPDMIFKLLDKCLEESLKDTPKFTSILVHSSSEIHLDFKEINPFRHLCHLSLLVNRGTDSQIKDFLAERIRKLQADSDSRITLLKSRLTELETGLRNRQCELEDYRSLSEKLKLEKAELQSKVTSTLSQELAMEKERNMLTAREMANKYENERRKIMENNITTTRTLENRVAALDYENKDLSEKKHRHEAVIQRLNQELKMVREDFERVKHDLNDKKQENNNLDAGYHGKERTINQLKLRIDLLEKENHHFGIDLRQQTELLGIANEQKSKLELELKEKRDLVIRRENTVRSVTQELMKANEIIKKFQEQARNQHQKVKLGSNVVQEQERLLTEKDNELEKALKELRNAREHQGSLENLQITSEKSLKDKDIIIEDLEKRIKTNETVIHWLNKQLTTAVSRDPGLQLGPAPDGAGFSLLTSSTPVGGSFKSNKQQKQNLARKLTVSVGSPITEEQINKENHPGSLDPKYFQATKNRSAVSKPNISSTKSKDITQKGSSDKSASQPLSSVYFP